MSESENQMSDTDYRAASLSMAIRFLRNDAGGWNPSGVVTWAREFERYLRSGTLEAPGEKHVDD